MPNTLGTTNGTLIAQKTLEMLKVRLPVLRKISTDFTSENAKYNQDVVVHVVSPASAILFDPAVGYAPSARTQVDVPVKIDKHIHHTYGVSVQEASSASIDLVTRLAESGAYSIGSAMVSAMCELVTAANFANKTIAPLGAGGDGFNRKALIRVGAKLGKRGVPPGGRFALLNADYYASLCEDMTIVSAMNNPGQRTISSGELPDVHSFSISEYVDLPDNGEDLMGFAGNIAAMAMAARLPDDPGQGQSNCRISVVTEPETGLSIQVREWYEATLAQYRRTYTLMFGVAKAQTAALERIASK